MLLRPPKNYGKRPKTFTTVHEGDEGHEEVIGHTSNRRPLVLLMRDVARDGKAAKSTTAAGVAANVVRDGKGSLSQCWCIDSWWFPNALLGAVLWLSIYA